jgi:Leucine-rich repeat (LRR) protein
MKTSFLLFALAAYLLPAQAALANACQGLPPELHKAVEIGSGKECAQLSESDLLGLQSLPFYGEFTRLEGYVIKKEDFAKIPNVKYLSFEYETVELAPQALDNLRLEGISLRNSEVKGFTPALISGQKNLRYLVLESTDSVVLEPAHLESLASLQELVLQRAETSSPINAAFLRNNPKLHHVTLSRMGPGMVRNPVPRDILRELGQLDLVKLNLPWNGLADISEGALARFPKLEELDLDANPIAELTAGLFRGTPKLKNLKVGSASHAMKIAPQVLHPLRQLTQVDLIGKMETVSEDLFRENKNLEWICLGGNLLKQLPQGLFQGLEKLQRILLSGNDLTELAEYQFARLPALESVMLEKNQVRKVPDTAFEGSGKLKYVSFFGARYVLPEAEQRRIRALVPGGHVSF